MMSPQDYLPQLADWVAQLDDVFPGKQIKPYFAYWEILHIVTLVLLGGSSILLNLRLIGYGLTDETPDEVRKGVEPWLHAGVWGVVLTGLLIGSSNAERLYTSEAFTAKMLGLLAGIILTYGVTLPAAKANGPLDARAKAAAVVGLMIWAGALVVFGVGTLINPGLWHVLFAGSLIVLFVSRGLTRIIYVAGMLLTLTAHQLVTHVMFKPDDFAHLDPANKGFFALFTVWVLGAAAVQIVSDGRSPGSGAGPGTKALAYAGILVWIMTAAAGRWIAFA